MGGGNDGGHVAGTGEYKGAQQMQAVDLGQRSGERVDQVDQTEQTQAGHQQAFGTSPVDPKSGQQDKGTGTEKGNGVPQLERGDGGIEVLEQDLVVNRQTAVDHAVADRHHQQAQGGNPEAVSVRRLCCHGMGSGSAT